MLVSLLADSADDNGSIGGLEGLDAPPSFLVDELLEARATIPNWHPLTWVPESLRWILDIDRELGADRTERGTPFAAVTAVLDGRDIFDPWARDQVRELIRWIDAGRATAEHVLSTWLMHPDAQLPRAWPDEQLDDDLDGLDLEPDPEPVWDPLRFAREGVGVGG